MLNKSIMNEEYCADEQPNTKLNYVDTAGNIYILGDFDSSISQNVVPGLVKRIQEETDKPNGQIWFYINSRGGYCHELYNLLSLIDVAKSVGIKIYTVIMGNAYSCGSILAIHGDHRAIYKYGKHLAHLGQQGDTVTTFKQIERSNKKMVEHFENIVQMYKDNTDMPEKMIREVLLDDSFYMNAEECKKYGFVDEIIGEKLPVEEVSVKDGDVLQVNGVPLKIRFKEGEKKEYKNKPNKQKQRQKKKESK
jgi:ATP-dependent protease ClpP protease subunit